MKSNYLKIIERLQRKPARIGQAITEFALILPVLLLLIFGIIEFARVFQAYLVIDNAARFGVRYAVTGEYNPVYCQDTADGPDKYGVDGPCAGAAKNAEEDSARLLSIYDVVRGSAGSIAVHYYYNVINGYSPSMPPEGDTTPGTFIVSVCSSRTGFVFDETTRRCRDAVSENFMDDAGNPEEGETRVIVSITFQHPLILPYLSSNWPSVRLHAERSGILEHFRVARVLGLPPDVNVYLTKTPTQTNTPTSTPTPTPTDTPTATPTPTATSTPTVTNTPIPTDTPTITPTPTVDCEQLSATNLRFDYSRLVFDVKNNDPYYSAFITGIDTTWNGNWHNEATPFPTYFKFKGYVRNGSQFDDRPDVPLAAGFHVAHNDLTSWGWQFSPLQSANLGLGFSNSFHWKYFHGKDFNLRFDYKMVPPGATEGITCPSVQLTGRYGPVISPTIPPQPITVPFSISADAFDPDGSIRNVYFEVRDSSGDIVGYKWESAAPYCIFGDKNSVCKTRAEGDNWPGGSTKIINGIYSIFIKALDWDSGGNYYHRTALLRNVELNLPTATPTYTPTITPTPTNTLPPTITRTPTNTLTIPTDTPTCTPTITPKPSKTPTPTQTATITKTPTKTPVFSKTPTRTPTRTNTPYIPPNTRTPTSTPTRTPRPTSGGGG